MGDIDNWLCNLYFEVIKLPRYLGGQKEFEVELNFTSSLLGHPDRLFGAEESRDGEQPEVGVESTLSDVVPSTAASSSSLTREPMTALSTPPQFIKGIKSADNNNLHNRNSIRKKTKPSISSKHKQGGISSSSSSSSEDEEYEEKLRGSAVDSGALKRHVTKEEEVEEEKREIDISDDGGGKIHNKSLNQRIAEG